MSKYLPEKRFSFISSSHSVDRETFGVVQFTGSEGISIPYEFDIMLVSDNANIDLDDMLASPVKFTIHRKNGTDVDFHGMLDSFEQLHKYDSFIFYRAHLVPRLWWLSVTHHNQVCLSKTVPEIIELALRDSGLQKSDFEFKLRSTYKPLGYVCQYNESHFNFISRWLEREGIYYFFDQQGPNEKIIFADTSIAHTILPDVSYIPPDGLAGKENAEILSAFICRQKQLPQKIMLKDYNYERPSLDVKGFADVDDRGKGVDYIYGESFPDSDEGNRLASIRAEIHNSRKREFIGESSVPFLSPGYIFTLKGHYRSDFNQQYLVTGITHEGNQVGYLLPGITQGLKGYENTIYYRNSFTSIPANVQYRSELKAQKSRIAGTLNATIDAEGSGQYAELDNYGRYKVRLPFDESSEHRSGKASTYLRMLQPYANQKGGMQFPLTKGTEVLLTFIDGDPDRPVIAGAIANPETPSPVTDRNQTEAVIQTGGNNKIRIEDKKGKERIIMESPTAGSWMRIGAPNDPPNPIEVEPGGNANTFIDSDGTWNLIKVNSVNQTSIDTSIQSNSGKTLTYKTTRTFSVSCESRSFAGLALPGNKTYKTGISDLGHELTQGDSYAIDSISWRLESTPPVDMAQYPCDLTFSREKNALLKIIDLQQYGDNSKNGIRIYSDENLWMEACTRYGEYRVGVRADGPRKANNETIPKTGDLLAKFGSDYNPAGMLARHGGAAQSFDDVLRNAHIRASSLDTVNTQEGNIYDFGGYWNYSMGNSYEEKFMNQKNIVLNSGQLSHDRAAKGGPEPGSITCDKIGNLSNDTWISKTIGGANYNYSQNTKSLEVENGTSSESHTFGKNSYDFIHGGRTEETKYSGDGKKVSHTWSAAGQSAEESYDPTTGSLVSYEFKSHKHFTYEASIPNYPCLKISTCASALLDTTINIAANQKLELDLAANLNFKLSGGIGYKFEYEMKPIKITYNQNAKKLEYHGPFSEVDKRADIRAKNEKLLLSKLTTKVVSQNCQFDMAEAVVYKHSMDAMIGTFFHL